MRSRVTGAACQAAARWTMSWIWASVGSSRCRQVADAAASARSLSTTGPRRRHRCVASRRPRCSSTGSTSGLGGLPGSASGRPRHVVAGRRRRRVGLEPSHRSAGGSSSGTRARVVGSGSRATGPPHQCLALVDAVAASVGSRPARRPEGSTASRAAGVVDVVTRAGHQVLAWMLAARSGPNRSASRGVHRW